MTDNIFSTLFSKYKWFQKNLSFYTRKFFGAPVTPKVKDTDIEVFYDRLARSLNTSFHRAYDTEPDTENQDSPDAEKPPAGGQPDSEQLQVDNLVQLTNERFHQTFSKVLSTEMSRGVLRQIEQQYQAESGYERFCDRSLTRLRWFAALIFFAAWPIIFGIIIIIAGESWVMLEQSANFAYYAFEEGKAEKQILADLYGTILSMLDMMLISALVMMVTVGGYENTVSRIGLKHAYPRWFGKLDIGELKIKVAASIATISAIHLLLNFMMIGVDSEQEFDSEVIMWTAIVHVVFVVSAFLLAYMNKISHPEYNPHLHIKQDESESGDGKRKKAEQSDISV